MSKEAIEKVEATTKKEGAEELDRIAPDKEQFDAMIQPNQMPDKVTQEQQAAKPSLLQEVAESDPKSKVSEKKLLDQMRTTTERIDQAKEMLSSAGENVKLKKSYVRPLRNHLSHIDDNIKIAQTTVGIEGKEFKQDSKVNPLASFFGTLDHQEKELEGVFSHVENAVGEGKELSTEGLLLVQLKVNQVQQQLEFFIALLNKALESTKTLMNIQV